MTFGKGKVFLKKFFISIFIFSIVVQQVLAHGKEFKNMLVDLEIARAGEETYKVNLKTEIPYPDEIKIVKKSDYNYYILLAETYSLVKTTKSSGVIKSIKVDTYPYAEQNFENGFTKVTFNTTRPVDFVVSLSANKASKFPVMDLVRLARLDNLYKENNFDYLNPKYKVAVAAPPVKTQVAQEKQQAVKQAEKPVVKTAQKEAKPAVKPVQKEVQPAVKQAPTTKVAQQSAPKSPVTTKPVIAQKPVATQKTTVAQKSVDIQKQAQSVKVAQAQKTADVKKQATTQKPTVAQKPEANVKVAQAQKPATSPIVAKKEVQKAPAKPASSAKEQSKQVKEAAMPEAKKAEQTKQPQAQKQEQTAKANKAPVETVEVQTPKEIPQEADISEDKAPQNIELEPIEKIDEESVQHDFKTLLLSFLIGNKISILVGLILLFALSALYNMKKKSAHNAPVPTVEGSTDEAQTTESFENVLSEETQAPTQEEQMQSQNEEAKQEVSLEKIEPQEEISETEEVIVEEPVAQEEQEEVLAQENEDVETAQQTQTEETMQTEEIAQISNREAEQINSVEKAEFEALEQNIQEISQEDIEEEIEQEIQQEIENENMELIETTQEPDDNLEVAEIKAEIVSAMDGALNPPSSPVLTSAEEEVIEIQKAENLSVHNLDIINRQAPSGNYDDDLIELDDIKDEIAEIKNNLASNEQEAQNQAQKEVEADISQIVRNEKPQTEQVVASVEIPKQNQQRVSKPSIEIKRKPELKPAVQRTVQQPTPKPAPIKKAPVKKAPVARILCKTPIENDRGLYLADYAGNKALVGYVNNNVFVLYNFKKTKIMNNEIIFRLSEAKPREDLYYVMVDNKKFLIKSEQYRMSLMQKIS